MAYQKCSLNCSTNSSESCYSTPGQCHHLRTSCFMSSYHLHYYHMMLFSTILLFQWDTSKVNSQITRHVCQPSSPGVTISSLQQCLHNSTHSFTNVRRRSVLSCMQAAIKFYLQRKAFDSEKELYMDPQLCAMMPATLAIEDNMKGEWRTPYGFQFPPFVIIERGQSLDEWARDNNPDFITIFQVLGPSNFIVCCDVKFALQRRSHSSFSCFVPQNGTECCILRACRH